VGSADIGHSSLAFAPFQVIVKDAGASGTSEVLNEIGVPLGFVRSV
jgi:hypothetical protein